jgi:hypothetical protein
MQERTDDLKDRAIKITHTKPEISKEKNLKGMGWSKTSLEL